MCSTRGKKSGHEEPPDKGTFWRVTVLETDTRLRVARGVEKNEADATLQALKTLAQRSGMNQPPPLASDGHNGCGEAMVDTWGQVPQRKKGRGRPPTKKKRRPIGSI